MVCSEGKVLNMNISWKRAAKCLITLWALPKSRCGTGTQAMPHTENTHCSCTATHTARHSSLSLSGLLTLLSRWDFLSLCSPGGIFWLHFALDPSFLQNHLPFCFHALCSGSQTQPHFYLGTLLLFLQHVLEEAVCVHPHPCPSFLPPSLHSAPVRLTLISPLFLSITHPLLSHTLDLIWF